jgi:membrane-bound lytic murein transglycosylase MltF
MLVVSGAAAKCARPLDGVQEISIALRLEPPLHDTRGKTMRAATGNFCLIILMSLLATGCSNKKAEPNAGATAPAATGLAIPAAEPETPIAADDEPLPPLAYESELPEVVRTSMNQSFMGDLDEMIQRRVIRVGVTFNHTHYFVDKGVQRGVAYEYGKLMEDELNKRRKTGNMKVFFWFVPLPRNQLLPALVDGKVDMVIAQLTVTPERQELVDFTNPTRKDVNEIVVTGPGAPPIASVDDLAGQEVFVRKTSSYYQSLLALNERLRAAGKPPVILRPAPENLEDEDLLEMANAGLIKIVIVDNYLAQFWNKVFADLVVHETVAVRTGGRLAVAIRKDSPQLAAALNAVIDQYGLGTTFGNTMQKRYLQNTQYVLNATSDAERRKFHELAELFKKYSTQYQLDYLLMAAQGYQESRLDQQVKSPVGAIGVMQIMPATGQELQVGDVREIEPNINAGVKYIRFIIDEYYKDEPMTEIDKGLFAFASYNAGPGRIRQLRREAAKRGLDPNVWFGNVEQIASERIGRETVTYVSNIYKYYVAYRLVTEESARRATAKEAFKAAGGKPAQ